MSFTVTNTNPSASSQLIIIDPTYYVNGKFIYASQPISYGSPLIVDKLQIQNPLAPLNFSNYGNGGISVVSNLTIFEDYIEPDCLVIAGNVDVPRPNPEFFDVDFSSNAITAVNAVNIISASRGTGSATPSTSPASNYTTARIANPRYNGCKNTSPDFNVITDKQLPSVEKYTSYFIYSPGGRGNTLAERSGSGNYQIGFLVDELGNITQPNNDNTSSAYIPNLLDAFGADTSIILSPNNNYTLSGSSEFTIYKPAVISNIILFSDTGSIGNNFLVSGTYATLSFEAVPGLYTQPYGLYVQGAGQSLPASFGYTTASFYTASLDQAGGFKTNTSEIPYTNTYTVQNTSPVRAAFSASFYIRNLAISTSLSVSVQVNLLENNTQIAQQTKNIPSMGNVDFSITSSLFLNSDSEYYVTIRANTKNVSVTANLWTIVPITSSAVVNTPYFTTGSTTTSVLTSSAALGSLYGSYQQTLPPPGAGGSGSGFDQPQPLTFLPYDEIRFEGTEGLVSTIITSSFNQSTGLFYLFLQDPVNTTSVDVNYFAIRRWVPSINNIIINTPGTIMGTGFIFPKYPSPLLRKNLPSIIENLTNKGLV